ncbi:F-box/FBD/LRR-repeat protein At1g13570-like [Lycium barbarum]|uniref:F-box/FBD/LRR-repeat protein At1g13570-like n=1 Tax=Lycium barbarum TaxID=112863 RepID=UPI00293F43C0|nr:F-box/FBD/LRR-repeat protein At1g13570-like [Lycium barbarum]
MHPNLVLDEVFFENLAVQSQSYSKQTVDEILLLHRGDIVKFVLGSTSSVLYEVNVAEAVLPTCANLDRWMNFVTRNGVKKLILAMLFDTRYKLPSCVFNCPTLTDLELGRCVIKPPISFLGFPNLEILRMTDVTIEPTSERCVISLPRLVTLNLRHCGGTQYLNIVSPKLVYNDRQMKDFLKILMRFLNENRLDTVPMMLPFSVDCLLNLSIDLDSLQLSRTSGALQLLLNCAPNLSTLEFGEELLRLPRASPTAELYVFPRYARGTLDCELYEELLGCRSELEPAKMVGLLDLLEDGSTRK